MPAPAGQPIMYDDDARGIAECAVLNGADFQECCASLGTRDETNLKEVHSVFMANRTLGLQADNLTPL